MLYDLKYFCLHNEGHEYLAHRQTQVPRGTEQANRQGRRYLRIVHAAGSSSTIPGL